MRPGFLPHSTGRSPGFYSVSALTSELTGHEGAAHLICSHLGFRS